MRTTILDLAPLVAGKRFMVTGASGFIGGHLVSTLAHLGAERVVAVDRQPLHSNPFLRALEAPNVSEVHLALGEGTPESLAPPLRAVDAVFHLAAVKYRPDGEPLFDVLRSNVLGTAAVLESSARAGVSKIVFTSSLYAYGRTRGEPFDEAEEARPCTAYGHSKRFGEKLFTLRDVSVPRFTVLRYMFVYGPGQSPKHGYPSVIVRNFVRMLRGERPEIYGDGAQVLDYVFVDDVIEATIQALRPEADGSIYNVGSGQGASIADLIALMRDVARFGGQPEFLPPDSTAGTRRVARIDRIRTDLGWTPVTPLGSGLPLTLASIRQHPDWYSQGETAHAPRS